MCYSAMVEQDLKSLSRRLRARIDYASFEEIIRRRIEGESINIGKAMEANFDSPTNDAESTIKTYIDQYREQVGKKWESALFA